MSGFFTTVAGVTVTVIWIIAIAIVSGVYIAVRFFGVVITFGYLKENNNEEQRNQ